MQNLNTVFNTLSTITKLNNNGSKHVIVLSGGMSAERFISIESGKAVTQALLDNKYKVTIVDPGKDIGAVLLELKPDVVYNNLHGTYGEDGSIPGLLNIMRIPYTHSGLHASSIAFNKLTMRQFFSAAQEVIFTNATLVEKNNTIKTDPMPRPYVIKPLSQGSSIGINIIMPDDDYDFANYDFAYGEQILIEQYIKGREIQVAILNGKALGVLEVQVLKNRFYDYQAKYTDGYTKHIVPAPLKQKHNDQVLRISEYVYHRLGCNGIARVEFLFDEEAEIFYFLEINTHPGMTKLSICPEIAQAVGVEFNQMIQQIIDTAKYE